MLDPFAAITPDRLSPFDMGRKRNAGPPVAFDTLVRLLGFGADATNNPLTTNRTYTIATDAWASGGTDLATRRMYHCFSKIGDLTYVTAGRSGTSGSPAAVATHQSYSTTGDSYVSLTALPAVRMNSAAALLDGDPHVMTGTNGPSNQTTNYEYNVAGNSWATKTAISAAPSSPGVFTLGAEDAYVMQASTQRYRKSTDAWAILTAPPASRAYPGSTTVSGTGYVMGGATGTDTNWRYNVGTDTWTTLTASPQSRHQHGLAYISDVHALAFGGATAGAPTSAGRYNVNTNSWAAAATIPSAVVGPGTGVHTE
jgi:hypothetical protein